MTAMASPMARPTPSTTAAAMPLFAAGTDTLKYVSMGVAPRASDASSYSRRHGLERRDRDLDDGRQDHDRQDNDRGQQACAVRQFEYTF